MFEKYMVISSGLDKKNYIVNICMTYIKLEFSFLFVFVVKNLKIKSGILIEQK